MAIVVTGGRSLAVISSSGRVSLVGGRTSAVGLANRCRVVVDRNNDGNHGPSAAIVVNGRFRFVGVRQRLVVDHDRVNAVHKRTTNAIIGVCDRRTCNIGPDINSCINYLVRRGRAIMTSQGGF